MNVDDEEEYEEFYDYTKIYKDQSQVLSSEYKKDKDAAPTDEWEDVDFESGDDNDDVIEEVEETKEEPKESDNEIT